MAPQFKAHPKHPAVDYLVRLHADIGGKILENRKEMDRLKEDMRHVEAVLRMFDPEFDTAAIVGRRRVNGNPYFKRGTLFREAIGVLRKAEKPMCARDLIVAMLAAKGVADAPAERIRSLTGGLVNSMRNNEGRIVERVGEDSPMRWKIV
jgi:hypothetical protein